MGKIFGYRAGAVSAVVAREESNTRFFAPAMRQIDNAIPSRSERNHFNLMNARAAEGRCSHERWLNIQAAWDDAAFLTLEKTKAFPRGFLAGENKRLAIGVCADCGRVMGDWRTTRSGALMGDL
jgi:hypothetical protein